jgi:hypothetical protein
MKNVSLMILLMILSLIPDVGFAQSYSDYLILQDINPYKLESAQKVVGGYIGGPRVFDGAGAIAPTGHFYPDHTDKTYEAYYEGGSNLASATVQVTKHSNSDSDKWLLHEVEDGYRDPDVLEANWTQGARVREIDGKLIFGVRGSGYTWLSGNSIVVNVEYTDLTGTKPEPLEVIKAYLQKLPSSITLTDAEAKIKAHSETWIRDEMDRRLWLCDKWFLQLTLKKAEENQVYQESVRSMNIFLDYREKYYGTKATDEKNLLAGYLNSNNGTSIKAKLAEYKNWWSIHKTDAISLP